MLALALLVANVILSLHVILIENWRLFVGESCSTHRYTRSHLEDALYNLLIIEQRQTVWCFGTLLNCKKSSYNINVRGSSRPLA